LDLNLDIEVQLKAKIHGDLTLGLLLVFPFLSCFPVSFMPGLVLITLVPRCGSNLTYFLLVHFTD
jgi:hypothetical protein